VTSTTGRFDAGDTVSVLADGVEVARGVVAYSEADTARILGRRSSDIEALLGYRGRNELIHRDDLVLMQDQAATAAAPTPADVEPDQSLRMVASGEGCP
jgi:glutamate 5-kinase